jgi:L-fuculose-phosphate aldolase
VSVTSEHLAAGPAIVRVCRRLYDRGLIAGSDGNVSVRLDDGTVLVTPSGASKADLDTTQLVRVSIDGTVLCGGRPSSEVRMHLRIYERRVDVRAVVHAHPPVATGFAASGHSFMTPVLPEVILKLGEVPLLPYATPGTSALADSLEPYLTAGRDAFLLANHGATTVGATLELAHDRMESLEHAARILLVARALGGPNALSAADVLTLRALREGAQ